MKDLFIAFFPVMGSLSCKGKHSIIAKDHTFFHYNNFKTGIDTLKSRVITLDGITKLTDLVVLDGHKILIAFAETQKHSGKIYSLGDFKLLKSIFLKDSSDNNMRDDYLVLVVNTMNVNQLRRNLPDVFSGTFKICLVLNEVDHNIDTYLKKNNFYKL